MRVTAGAAPTGAWNGKANKLAGFFGGAWRFLPDVDSDGTDIPIGARHEGLRVWVNDENTFYRWTGSAWVARYLDGSVAYDPPNLVDGARAATTVTVTGAALGDFPVASFSLDLQGIEITAHVSAADTVRVVLVNNTGGTLDIANGTLRARVWKQ